MRDDIILSVLEAVAVDLDTGPAVREEMDEPESMEAPVRSTRWTLPGFCSKAKVATSFGELPVQALRLRDPVKTKSGVYRRVAWIDQIHLDEGFLNGFKGACPIRIQRHALGSNYPNQNTLLSPGQTVLVPQEWSDQTVQSAEDLTVRTNIDRLLSTHVTYYLFHCGTHEEVLVDGMWCEVSP